MRGASSYHARGQRVTESGPRFSAWLLYIPTLILIGCIGTVFGGKVGLHGIYVPIATVLLALVVLYIVRLRAFLVLLAIAAGAAIVLQLH